MTVEREEISSREATAGVSRIVINRNQILTPFVAFAPATRIPASVDVTEPMEKEQKRILNFKFIVIDGIIIEWNSHVSCRDAAERVERRTPSRGYASAHKRERVG